MLKILIALLFFAQLTYTQTDQNLHNDYHYFIEKSLTKSEVKHFNIVPLINKLKNSKLFSVEKAGSSLQNRDIYLIKFGMGETKIFLWSQMHGDEATATKALFDIFNFFDSKNDNFKSLREELLDKISFYVIPMVNPDGAEINDRRNALGIDLNRDAVEPQSPESAILRNTFEQIKPDFGFNLHDQYPRYSVGKTKKTASLSFLAPSTGEPESTISQMNAIRLIGELFLSLNKFIPGHIAKYSDEYEPRAFGDNFQKWGSGTILIESGGWKNDNDKQFIRKLNFITLILAFESIARNRYKKFDLNTYTTIPFNERNHYDLIFRNLTLSTLGLTYKADLAINIYGNEIKNATIEEFGDLSTSFGLTEYDFDGYHLEKGNTIDLTEKSWNDIYKLNFYSLLSQGNTSFLIKDEIQKKKDIKIPQLLIRQNRKNTFEFYKTSPQLLIKKDDELHYIFVKGILYNIKSRIQLSF
ncbi:MAG: M14 family zinc carboxypeptidase [Ignavibacteria bacterium]|jgi:hypothetical protein|nr:M14 family zinc carboxypeptidase [Ignavibacteria bacterium]